MTSTEGRWVAMIRWIPARAGFSWLRRWISTSISLPTRHHQIGQFVDDQHDLRQRLVIELFFLEQLLPGLGIEPGLHPAGPAACPWRWRR